MATFKSLIHKVRSSPFRQDIMPAFKTKTMIGQNETSEKFVEEVLKHIEAKDFSCAINMFNDKRYEEYLKNRSWDLIPVICKQINEESKLADIESAVYCERLLEKLAAEANPEEVVLEFLDQMDEADSEKFKVILNLLKIVLSRDMSNRMKSIEWILNSVRSYTEQFSYDKNLDNSDSTEEVYTPDQVKKIENVMSSIIAFYEPLVKEAYEIPQNEELRSLLSSRLIQMFDIYLPYVKIKLFPQLQSIQWRIMHLLSKLISNPMLLLEYVFYRALNVTQPNLSSKSVKALDMRSLSEENLTLIEPVKSLSPFEDETIVSNMAYGMFFFSLLSETENEQLKVPLIYNPKYVTLSLIYVTIPFFDKNDISVSYGLKFLDLLLDKLNDHLTKTDLYFSSHKNLLISLNNVMVYSQVEENRKLALTCFKKYIESFTWEGRYLLLLNFRPHVQHSGTIGFLINLLKEFLSKFLELPQSSQAHKKFMKYYKGKLLFDLIKKYCFMTNISNADLVENADQIISALNIFRYLVLRDKKNVTDVKNFIKKIHGDFLKPLKENITTSKKYYDLQLQNLTTIKSKTSINSSEGEIELELAVKEQVLPKLTKEQQITAYQSCLNAVDLIDSLLIRLIECVNDAFSCNL